VEGKIRLHHHRPDAPHGRLHRLGREYFTMDPKMSKAVTEVFVRLTSKA
jgi:hypothetical protein